MLRNPRTWFFAAGGWLLLAGVAHAGTHTWSYVLENGIIGYHDFAMRAMKQAFSMDPLQPTMWRQFRMFSASFSLFLTFAGSATVLLAWMAAPPRILRAFALFAMGFWTAVFALYVFVEPVIQPILISGLAVPIYAVAWVTANAAVLDEQEAGEES